MARRKLVQTNFSAGELDPTLHMRQDTEQYQGGARSLRNRRCLIGGGTKRRPGTWFQAANAGTARIEAFIVDQATAYVLVFTDARMDAYRVNATTGQLTAAGSVTGADWTGDIFEEMDYEQAGDTAFLFHADMMTQVLTRTGASTWAKADLTFYSPSVRTEQPYYKVAEASRTLTPSDVVGSITLTISGSAAFFTASHVGQVIRYVGRECTITAVAANGLSCTATVLETLPETYSLTVTSSATFLAGEIVEGATTGARGYITSIPDATHLVVVLIDSLIVFGTEAVVSENGSTSISATATTTNAGMLDWDEQIIGAAYGYPSCGVLHRNRLLLAGHPAVPNGLMGSKFNNLYSFDVGDASDADGFFETIGDAGASEIVQLYSAEQLLIATDYGLYYCPESDVSPFRPSSIAFFPFGSRWPITASAAPRGFDDGVLFVSGSLLIKARPTGNQKQAWAADEVSLLSSHLVSNPTRQAVVSNFSDGPERYAVAVNDDGSLAVLQLVEAQKIRNMVPWDIEDTVGGFTGVAAVGGFLYATSTRRVAGSTQYFLELFDQDVTLDLTTEYATQVLMDAGIPTRYGATTVNVVTADLDYHLGEYPLVQSSLPAGPYHVGIYYDTEIETLPPVIDDAEGARAGEVMRICPFHVRVRQSARFTGNGTTLAAYGVHDAVDEPPPAKDGWYRFEPLGWSDEPTVILSQPDPLPLDVLAIKATVAF